MSMISLLQQYVTLVCSISYLKLDTFCIDNVHVIILVL